MVQHIQHSTPGQEHEQSTVRRSNSKLTTTQRYEHNVGAKPVHYCREVMEKDRQWAGPHLATRSSSFANSWLLAATTVPQGKKRWWSQLQVEELVLELVCFLVKSGVWAELWVWLWVSLWEWVCWGGASAS